MYSIIYVESCSIYIEYCSYLHLSVFRAEQHDPVEGSHSGCPTKHMASWFTLAERAGTMKSIIKKATEEGLFYHDYFVGQLLPQITGKKMSVHALTANPKT